jgi:hypothetical protein
MIEKEFSMLKKRALVLVAVSSLMALVSGSSEEKSDIRGAWHADTYFLKGGARHPVEGLIFFTDSDWTVLFFVMGEDGRAWRGSGEGGTYALAGDQLVFTHYYHLASGRAMTGLDESPLRMEVHSARDASTEPCRVEIEYDRMTLYFPSGNRMSFRRSSR